MAHGGSIMYNYLPLQLTTKYDRENIIMEPHKIQFQKPMACLLKGSFFPKVFGNCY